jgi:branched-subunit amino acid transport protein
MMRTSFEFIAMIPYDLNDLIRFLPPILLSMIVLEAMLIQRSRKTTFSWKESVASLAIAVGHRAISAMFAVIPIGMYSFIWEHRLFTVSFNHAWSILLLFLGLEFFYYLKWTQFFGQLCRALKL